MYQIYPTLLDAFLRYKKSYDYSEAGVAEQELLDRINRVERPLSEPALRGIALEKLVNGEFFRINCDGFMFDFDIIKELRLRVERHLKQVFADGELETKYGNVRLYGYVDYLFMNKAIDLKFLMKYDLNKYFDSVQRIVYPYLLNQSGIKVDEFEFLATDNRSIFVETYNYDKMKDVGRLTGIVESFIEYVESMREKIYDMKIFGLEPAAER